MKFRKKAVEVEAWKLTPESLDFLSHLVGGRPVEEIDSVTNTKYVGLNIPTLEGVMRASEGDYIIRGVQGEFYPCKPSIFEATYEAV